MHVERVQRELLPFSPLHARNSPWRDWVRAPVIWEERRAGQVTRRRHAPCSLAPRVTFGRAHVFTFSLPRVCCRMGWLKNTPWREAACLSWKWCDCYCYGKGALPCRSGNVQAWSLLVPETSPRTCNKIWSSACAIKKNFIQIWLLSVWIALLHSLANFSSHVFVVNTLTCAHKSLAPLVFFFLSFFFFFLGCYLNSKEYQYNAFIPMHRHYPSLAPASLSHSSCRRSSIPMNTVALIRLLCVCQSKQNCFIVQIPFSLLFVWCSTPLSRSLYFRLCAVRPKA